jgi:6-phosphogluconolactonase
MRKKRLRPLMLCIFMAIPLLGTIFVLSPVSSALAASNRDVAGHVYVLNNTAHANSISVFNRFADGTLAFVTRTRIGGQGSGSGLGSQGSLILSPDRNWLFAVDAGSNQVSVVAVGSDGGLRPASVSTSRGVDPISLTYSNGHLYVLNAGDNGNAANVSGFRVHSDGTLSLIAGSIQPLSVANPGPAEVQADPRGDTLIVTEKTTNEIDSYSIHANGSLSEPTVTASTGNTPFGFAFNPAIPSQFIVSDAFGGSANAGALTSYRVDSSNVDLQDGPVADQQSAPCWVVITKDGRFAYTSNTGSGSVSAYSIERHGSLTLLSSASTGNGSSPIEMALTSSSRYL